MWTSRGSAGYADRSQSQCTKSCCLVAERPATLEQARAQCTAAEGNLNEAPCKNLNWLSDPKMHRVLAKACSYCRRICTSAFEPTERTNLPAATQMRFLTGQRSSSAACCQGFWQCRQPPASSKRTLRQPYKCALATVIHLDTTDRTSRQGSST